MKKKPAVSKGEIALLAVAALFLGALFLFRSSLANRSDAAVLTENDLPPDPPPEKYDLNLATAEELATLEGIGPELAGRIVRYREENGAFASVEELLNVTGIGEKKYEAVCDAVTVNGGETP